MLQSQRDTTRLCAKYIEPRQAKPFDSYSQDELRFRMMQLDGCKGRTPNTSTQFSIFEAKNSQQESRAARRQRVLDFIKAHDGVTLAILSDEITDVSYATLRGDFQALRIAGLIECTKRASGHHEWRATA